MDRCILVEGPDFTASIGQLRSQDRSRILTIIRAIVPHWLIRKLVDDDIEIPIFRDRQPIRPDDPGIPDKRVCPEGRGVVDVDCIVLWDALVNQPVRISLESVCVPTTLA